MSHMPILEYRDIPFTPSIFQPELFCPNRETLIYSTFALHQVHRRRCLKSPSLILTTTRQSCIQVVDKKGTVLAGELQDLLDVSDPPAWHPESVAFAPSITLTGTQPTVGSQCIIDSQRYLWFGAWTFSSVLFWLAVFLRLSDSQPHLRPNPEIRPANHSLGHAWAQGRDCRAAQHTAREDVMLRQDSGTPTNQGQVRGSKRPAQVPCEGISRTSSGKRAVPWQRRRRANAGHSRQVRPVQLGLQLEGFDSCSRSRGCHVESLVCPIQGCSHPGLTLNPKP